MPSIAATEQRLSERDLAGPADSAELLPGRSTLTTASCVTVAGDNTVQWSITSDATDRLADANSESIVLTASVTEIDEASNHSGLTPDSTASISLSDLQQMALSRNPTLSQAHALIQQAQGNWVQSGLYPNPVIGYDGNGNNGLFDAQGAYISQSFVTAGKLKLNRAVASHDVQRARQEAHAQNLKVMNEIAVRYTVALGAQRRVATTEELLKIAEDGVKTSERLFEGEEVSRADVLQARLHLNQTLVHLRDASYTSDAAWKQLGNVVGWPELPPSRLEGHLEDDVPDIDADVAWQHLLDGNPLLYAARSRASAARIQVRREEVQPYPDVKVTAGAWHDRISPPNAMLGVNVGIGLPVFDRNQGNIRAATGELIAAESEVARLELVLRDAMAAAYQRYQSARNQVQTYHDLILPTAEENLALTLKGYEAGELDFMRVLTARRDLFEARGNYITSLTDLKVSAIEIRGMLLTGGLDAVESRRTQSNAAGQTNGAGSSP
ncbi:MAG TPA: TolC family protein [Planctomycetaceae bacterium]|nr:TolC family protein [Planctomycetaceae bacterium]HQZ66308.1 TolC family protein [Planctomycetaceae bacterium]